MHAYQITTIKINIIISFPVKHDYKDLSWSFLGRIYDLAGFRFEAPVLEISTAIKRPGNMAAVMGLPQ